LKLIHGQLTTAGVLGLLAAILVGAGMPHVFQTGLAVTPESKTTLGKVDTFLKQHLSK